MDESFQWDLDYFQDQWLYSHYEEHLRGGVFHSTRQDHFQGILKDGLILPSDRGREFTYPQTDNSYALHHGYVSLLDFRRSLLEIGQTFLRWGAFVLPGKPVILIQMDQSFIDERIIRYEDLDYDKERDEQGVLLVWIPYIEAWYPDKIPLEHAVRFFLVDDKSETFEQIQPDEYLNLVDYLDEQDSREG